MEVCQKLEKLPKSDKLAILHEDEFEPPLYNTNSMIIHSTYILVVRNLWRNFVTGENERESTQKTDER